MSLLDSLFGIQKIFLNGVELVTRKAINLTGSVTAVDNPTLGRTDITLGGGAGIAPFSVESLEAGAALVGGESVIFKPVTEDLTTTGQVSGGRVYVRGDTGTELMYRRVGASSSVRMTGGPSLAGVANTPVSHATNATVTEGQAALFLLAGGSRTATVINPRVGARVSIKISGGTSSNQLTISVGGGGTVDGASSLVLTEDNEGVELLCVVYAETSEWIVTSHTGAATEGGGGGGGGGILGPGTTDVGRVVIWDSGDGTTVSQDDSSLTWDSVNKILDLPVLSLSLTASDPMTGPSGGFLYAKDDGIVGTAQLMFMNDDAIVARITTLLGAVAGTATVHVGYSTSETVFDGHFATFDLASAGTSLTATLDVNAPSGAHCVVKILGPASSFQLDIVDGAAQNIDGVATYTLTADNASARLTKLSDGTWAVG